MGITYKSFFWLPRPLLKCCTIFSLGEARPKGLFIDLLSLDINTFNSCKMKIWPLHIHSTSSKTQFIFNPSRD